MAGYKRTAALVVGAGAALAFLGSARSQVRRKKLAGKVVLITGGSRGLGLALARLFAKLGCPVAICARDHDELTRAEQEIAGAGHTVFSVVCDISDRAAVSAMTEAVIRRFGHIDILVN